MSKERPILFNGAMVRAILAGHKVQTRRAIKPQPQSHEIGAHMISPGTALLGCLAHAGVGDRWECPFGQPGDRLWVRESFTDLRGTGIQHRPHLDGPIQRYAYSADTLPGSAGDLARKDYGIKWRPSIHMPREACRLVLEITAVRVEQLQAISKEDALAEGLHRYAHNWRDSEYPLPDVAYEAWQGAENRYSCPRHAFRDLWLSTGGDWDGNPWVWVIEFKQVTA